VTREKVRVPEGPTDRADWGSVVSGVYSAEAPSYRDLWAPLLLPHGRELLAALSLNPASRVLDLGCGCGTLLESIRACAPDGFVVGIDRAAGMLAQAPPEFPRAVMDGARLGFASGVFDSAVAVFVLFHTPDPGRVLGEIRRVLRRGGSIGTTTWAGSPDFPAHRVWLEELDASGASADPVTMSDYEPTRTPERMRTLLEAAGFASVRTWTRPFGHLFTVDEFLEVRMRHGYNARRFTSLGPEARSRLVDRTRRRLLEMEPAGLLEDTGVVFAVAVAR
jgi:arsenite methyltransferase